MIHVFYFYYMGNAINSIIISSFFLIPIFIACNKLFFKSIKRSILYILFGFYIVSVMDIVGFPNIIVFNFNSIGENLNLIPFIDMPKEITFQILNLLLFIPLGIFLPILFERFRSLKNVGLFGFFMSLVIEVAQLFTYYRYTDINDIIMNTLGSILGYFLVMGFKKYIRPIGKIEDLYIVFGTVFYLLLFLILWLRP